jgi:hypothetical protein
MKVGISLSLIRRTLVLLIAAIPVAWISWQLTPLFDYYFVTARATTGYDLRVSRRLITYRLPPRTSVTFSFSRPLSLFRVLSCVSLASGVKETATGWVYGYQVEMLDANGNVMGKRNIYSRTVVHDREFQEEEKIRFFRGAETAITLDDNALIAAERPVAAIRLSRLASDPGVATIDVRVYERRPFIGSTALAAFRRRSPEEQAELSRANAFPADLLTEAEMSNIAQNQWRPVGPVGIEGNDYKMLVMYEYTKPRTTRKGEGK